MRYPIPIEFNFNFLFLCSAIFLVKTLNLHLLRNSLNTYKEFTENQKLESVSNLNIIRYIYTHFITIVIEYYARKFQIV